MSNKKKIKLPSKETMNLNQRDGYTGEGARKLRIAIIAVIVLFVAFAVVGRYVNVLMMKNTLESTKSELATIEPQLSNYDAIKVEYDRYSKSYMSADEAMLESRLSFIGVAQDAVDGKGYIESISIVGNEASVNVVVKSLDDVAATRRALEVGYGVNAVKVYTASDSDSNSSAGVRAALVFSMGEQIGGGDQ